MPPAHANPFRVERLHALPFIPLGTTWPALLARLEQLDCRAAIVGPHGTGKSTLLAALAGHLAARGFTLRQAQFNRDHRPRSPADIQTLLDAAEARDAPAAPDAVVLVDGYEQVPRALRSLLRRRCRRLIVTSHRRTVLPTLIRTRGTADLLRRLIAELVPDGVEAESLQQDSEALLRRHRGSIREALFELYDRWGAKRPLTPQPSSPRSAPSPRG